MGSGLYRYVQGVKFIKIAKKSTGSRPQKKYRNLNSVETYEKKTFKWNLPIKINFLTWAKSFII